ncbi:MAG: hypothetical protein AB1449_08445 [Chloroflexota bacterium]
MVEATPAASHLADLSGLRPASALRFQSLTRPEDLVSSVALWALAGWVVLLSAGDARAARPVVPRAFAWGGIAAAALAAIGGSWGIIRVDSLKALDGGDSLILVHLWIGVVAAVLIERGRMALGKA